jgi:hypothetical protein
VVRNAVNNVSEKLCDVGSAVNGKDYLFGQLAITLIIFTGYLYDHHAARGVVYLSDATDDLISRVPAHGLRESK